MEHYLKLIEHKELPNKDMVILVQLKNRSYAVYIVRNGHWEYKKYFGDVVSDLVETKCLRFAKRWYNSAK